MESSVLQTESVITEPTDIIPIPAHIGKFHGNFITEMPLDLYIPPDALQVFLEAFEGPLDLLLYLIKRQNLEILDISISQITTQYMVYVEIMRELHLELAAEYLVMAATLAEIKSRLLLPRPPSIAEEEDPRAELIRRLQEYERFKKAAEDLDTLPRIERENYLAHADSPEFKQERPLPQVTLQELIIAFQDVLGRAKLSVSHQVKREALSIRERMTMILDRLRSVEFLEFSELFTGVEGRAGAVVAFIAVLELLRGSLIDIVQTEPFAPLHIKVKTHE